MVLMVAGMVLGGCAKPPTRQVETSGHAVAVDAVHTSSAGAVLTPAFEQPMPTRIFGSTSLAGRTLAVGSTAEIALRPGEVILTFDDGPRPGRTDAILATLDQFGVKGTFMMLGSAAQAHPSLVRQVAMAGHTIGNHSYDHANLADLTRQAALDDIAKGERALTAALAGSGKTLAPFFRFPYLAQSGFLRTSMIRGNVVILDVDIDSKDYYSDTAATVVQRTLSRLDARGSGIILFHDIHARTVAMLPEFLAELDARGYSVVRLVPSNSAPFGREIITATAPMSGEAL